MRLTHLIDHPNANAEKLMEFIPGPDFPTHGLILGTKGSSRRSHGPRVGDHAGQDHYRDRWTTARAPS
ncbi:MAG: hypothetical protein QM758_16010 [Armatimonas sp.]